VILASRSPQRRAILEQLGIPFDVVVSDVEEIAAGEPVEVAVENARRKAEAVVPADDRPVLGVDTLVTLDGEIHGKPRDVAHAREMLLRLSGRRHAVVSGLALRAGGRTETVHAVTYVQFRDVQPLLQWYLDTGEWAGRAGGYAIQGRGAALVTGIEGDYLNVVGLPVAAMVDRWPGVLMGNR
jgi:septum formation protein